MSLTIEGPAGAIEARFDSGAETQQPVACAVLCHPHPQYGGSMHDGVLDTLARVLHARGIATFRFNFRGVGASAGRFDDGRGEADDLRAVIAHARAAHDLPLVLGGYSFGAMITWRVLADLQPPPAHAVLVAPPNAMMPFTADAPGCPVVAFAGEHDQFVDLDAFNNWPGVESHVVPGADHFFSSGADLAGLMGEALSFENL